MTQQQAVDKHLYPQSVVKYSEPTDRVLFIPPQHLHILLLNPHLYTMNIMSSGESKFILM